MRKFDWSRFGIASGAVFVLFFVILIIPLIMALKQSNDLREFKVDLFVLCNESTICTTEDDDGRIRISPENLYSLYALMSSTYGYFTVGNPAETQSLDMEFDCHDEKWDLSIQKVGPNKLRVILDGPRSYLIYIKDQDKFESFQKMVSLKGYRAPNKEMSKRRSVS